MTPLIAGPSVIMKAGPHAGEDLDAIIARKQRESAATGWCLWGYGGSACHPLTQIQPHAAAAAPAPVSVLFIQTSSTPLLPSTSARAYSADARTWTPIPSGHLVSGSKWALILRSLTRTNTEIDLGAYQVAIGPSAGKNLADYLRGRCDKACAVPASAPAAARNALVIATAELTSPHSVFLRLTGVLLGVLRASCPSAQGYGGWVTARAGTQGRLCSWSRASV